MGVAAVDFDYAAAPKAPVTCPVCGTDNPSTPKTDRSGWPIGLSRCACGLTYLNPRMTATDYAAFYQGPYRAIAGQFRPAEPLTQMRDSQRQYGRMLGGLLAHLRLRGGRCLDVGGSTGAVAQGIAGMIALAPICVLDPAEAEIALAAQAGLETRIGTLEDGDVSGPWDVILCCRTLDHCLDPVAGLRRLRAALAPRGWLWVDVVTQSRMKVDHPCYWTPRSLRRALTESGWRAMTLIRIGNPCTSAHLGCVCKGA